MANKFDYLSDNRVELRGPVNQSTGLPITEGTTTATARLYDASLDCRLAAYHTPLTADAVAGATSVFVKDNAPIFSGSIILIDLDNGQQDRVTVNSVTAGTGEIDITGFTLDSAASEGRLVTIVQYDDTSNVVSIDDFTGWEDGMNMEITLGDGTVDEFIVSLIDSDSGYLTLATTLTVATNAGAVVKRRLGSDAGGDNITMAAYGTFPTAVGDTIVGDETWGFRGTVPHDHPDIQLGMRVRAEITAVDTTPTPDLNLFRKVVATVINE